MPAQPPLGYHALQAMDPLQGVAGNSPLSQEFYQAASNHSTEITRPPQFPPEQHPVEDHHPDLEIEDAIANMQRHEQVSQMLPTNRNNNPQ